MFYQIFNQLSEHKKKSHRTARRNRAKKSVPVLHNTRRERKRRLGSHPQIRNRCFAIKIALSRKDLFCGLPGPNESSRPKVCRATEIPTEGLQSEKSIALKANTSILHTICPSCSHSVLPAPCEGIKEIVQQSEYQYEKEAVFPASTSANRIRAKTGSYRQCRL